MSLDTYWKLADATFKVLGSITLIFMLVGKAVHGYWPWE